MADARSRADARGDFTSQARAYARARPTYSREIADWIVTTACVTPGAAVAEIGSGTGLFTELLAGRGLKVTALEPNEAMRSHAPVLEDVVLRPGTFEDTGLAAGSQALVVAAQALHWADLARALPEIRRALAPAGRIAALFNTRDMTVSAPLRAARAVIDDEVPGFAESYQGVDWGQRLVSTGDFTGVATHQVRHVVTMNSDRFVDLWRSHNQLGAAAGTAGLKRIVQGMSRVLDGVAELDVHYRCSAWVASVAPG